MYFIQADANCGPARLEIACNFFKKYVGRPTKYYAKIASMLA